MGDSIAVIIPTLNEADHIGLVLGDLDNQTLAPTTVHVVDGGSTDATVEIVKSFTPRNFRLQIHNNSARRVPHALNIGYRNSSEQIVARVDGHCRLSSEYLEGVVDALRRGYSGSGGTKVAVAESTQGRANAACLNSRFGVGQSAYHFASEPSEVDHVPFGTYPRSVLDQVGGWDERFVVSQDFEIDYRIRQLGGRLLVVPRSQVDWRCRESIRGIFLQYRRYGAGKARVHSAYPRSLSISQASAVVVPLAALVAGGLSITGLARRLGLLPVLYALALASQGVLIGRDSARRNPDQPIRIWRLCLATTAMQCGYSAGYWEARLTGRQRASQGSGPDSSGAPR